MVAGITRSSDDTAADFAQADFTWEDPPEGLESRLRDKVRSKIDVAKILGGVIPITLGWVITSSGIDNGGVTAELAVVALLVSLILFLATIDAYDTLLMPPNFWWPLEGPFCAADVIHDEMVRIWKFLFVPASAAFMIGLVLLVSALIDPDVAMWASLAAGALGVAGLWGAFRPPILSKRSSRSTERWADKARARASRRQQLTQ